MCGGGGVRGVSSKTPMPVGRSAADGEVMIVRVEACLKEGSMQGFDQGLTRCQRYGGV